MVEQLLSNIILFPVKLVNIFIFYALIVENDASAKNFRNYHFLYQLDEFPRLFINLKKTNTWR